MVLEHIYNGEVKCCSHGWECIDLESLASQANAGYTFRLDGKKISLAQLKLLMAENDVPLTSKKPPELPDPSDIAAVRQYEVAAPVRKVRKIRCTNNGKVYDNMSAAGKDLGIDGALISYSLKVGRPTKGYSFEFID